MARQIRLIFPRSRIEVTAALLENDASKTCQYIWQVLEQPIEVEIEIDHSSGDDLVFATFRAPELTSENTPFSSTPGNLLFFDFSNTSPGRENGYTVGICYRQGAKDHPPSGWIAGNVFATVTQNLEGLQQVLRDVTEKGPQPLRLERITPAQLPWLREGIIQVGIVVKDLDQVVENYWNRCGIGPWRFYNYGKPPLQVNIYRGQPSECRFRIALCWIGPLCIELMEPVEGESVYTEFIKKHGYGLHHLAVKVEDMPTAIAQAASVGVKILQEGSGSGLDGSGHYAYLDTEETLGMIFELLQFPQVRIPPEKVYPADS